MPNEFKELYTDKMPYRVPFNLIAFFQCLGVRNFKKNTVLFLGWVIGNLYRKKIIALLPCFNGVYRTNLK
jgi:hypothetical protein